MGILNVTPDSFAGDRRMDPDEAAAAALAMADAGADIVDLGGESTRPGAVAVPADEEWRRVGPVLERLRGRLAVPVSIDTYKADIAARALAAGAVIVNDISGLTADPAMASVAARLHAAVVVMHHRGPSQTMYAQAAYADVVRDVAMELRARDAAAREAGIAPERIILDPGIGFAKRAGHSFDVLARFDELARLGRPLLSGPSRKSFMKAALGEVEPAGRVWGTAAAVTASVLAGAHIVRVHDVAAMAQVVRVADAIRAAAGRA